MLTREKPKLVGSNIKATGFGIKKRQMEITGAQKMLSQSTWSAEYFKIN